MYTHYLTGDPEVVLVDGRRTPTGRLLGALSNYSAVELGSICLRALEELVDPMSVDELILGSVIQAGQGQAPARQVLLDAGWSPRIPAVTINKVCGSGIKAVLQACEGIRGGPLNQVVAGGMESMSRAPYLLPNHRRGRMLGEDECLDAAVRDGLWCSVESEHMGSAAERIARRYHLERDELDEYALMSHRRATRAHEEGHREPQRVSLPELDRDEPVRPDTSLEQLGELSPAFEEDGIITAGNAPGLNDGAAMLRVATRRQCSGGRTAETLFCIEGYSVVGGEPGNLFETPAAAIEVLLEGMSWSLEDVDRVEINEAFAAQILANCNRLEYSPERINRWGGAIALGHPLGMSGARIVLTLMQQMRQAEVEKGLAAICMGGGNGIALAIRQVAA